MPESSLKYDVRAYNITAEKDLIIKELMTNPLALEILCMLTDPQKRAEYEKKGIEYRELASKMSISPREVGLYTQKLNDLGLAIKTGRDNRHEKPTELGYEIRKDLEDNHQLNL